VTMDWFVRNRYRIAGTLTALASAMTGDAVNLLSIISVFGAGP